MTGDKALSRRYCCVQSKCTSLTSTSLRQIKLFLISERLSFDFVASSLSIAQKRVRSEVPALRTKGAKFEEVLHKK